MCEQPPKGGLSLIRHRGNNGVGSMGFFDISY
jgi:hypothetical protein